MDVTKLSTKGQLVIPEKMRKGYPPGSSFLVSQVGKLLVLKPLQPLSEQEHKEIKELNTIWKEIDSGKADSYTEKEFFAAMKQW
jgi:bifunctional DNA-binding transcriptional regulator/antitoxin component of YhaV-PrlF toxin-antitoxin module